MVKRFCRQARICPATSVWLLDNKEADRFSSDWKMSYKEVEPLYAHPLCALGETTNGSKLAARQLYLDGHLE